LKEEKNNILVEIDNQTVAEILRVYLNEDDAVVLAAWKREHPDKPIIFEIKTDGKTAKKALEDAATKIEKQTDKLAEDFKKIAK